MDAAAFRDNRREKLGELHRVGKGSIRTLANDARGDATGGGFIAEVAENNGELLLAGGVHEVGGGDGVERRHTHVESSIALE